MKKIFTILLIVFLTTSIARSDYEFEFGDNSYKIVTTEMNWEAAAEAAVQVGGRLVHIDSEEEQNAIYTEIENAGIETNYTTVMDGGGIAYIWIGATDKDEEGTWIWDGDNDNDGINFWTGQGGNGDNDGMAIDNSFHNWGGKNDDGNVNEPDDFQNNQDAAAIALEAWPKNMGFLGQASEWNDINKDNELYYIIEFEGTTKVNTDKSSLDIWLTPNPAGEYIEISIDRWTPLSKWSPSEVAIYNMLGNKIISESIHPTTRSHRMNLEQLQQGIYFIQIGDKIQKFVKL